MQMKLRLLFNRKSYTSLLLIGILNGLLPCGLVYVAIFAAIGTGGAYSGALFMFIFGLGTLPMLFALSIFGNIIGIKFRTRINKLSPVVIVIIGVLFILRGANLGIMFISPPEKMLVPHQKIEKKEMDMKKNKKENEKIIIF
jgi:sulfite exporter TauE/SafE